MGPLEIKIEGIQKQIDESMDRCTQMQQFWLRQQNELVKKTRQSDDQAQSIDSLKKQLLILDQKKIRTDGNECSPFTHHLVQFREKLKLGQCLGE